MSETLEGIVVDVSKMETTTPTREKSSAVGNAAAMRKALEKVRRVLHCAIVADILKGDDVNGAFNEVIASLSAPPRNCDRYMTLEEAEAAWNRLTIEERLRYRFFISKWLYDEAKGETK